MAEQRERTMQPPRSPGVVSTTNDSRVGMDRWLPKYALDTDRPYDGDPWSRQSKETARAYDAFQMYLSIDPERRTYVEAGRVYSEKFDVKNGAAICQRYGSTHRWIERAEAWDAYMDAKTRRKLERRRLRVAEKQADQAEAAADVLSTPATILAQRMREQLAADGVTFMDALTDDQLLKLTSSLSKDVPGMQKAVRDALGSVTGTSQEPAKLKAKGDVLRRVLANPQMLSIVESLTIDVEIPLETTDD